MDNPQCQTVRRWIIAQDGRSVFAPFTSQDSAAFSAFVHGMELWLRSDMVGRESAVTIMRAAVRAMQPKVRYLCKSAIPAVGDWRHVEELWPQLEAASATLLTGRSPSEPPPMKWVMRDGRVVDLKNFCRTCGRTDCDGLCHKERAPKEPK